MESKELKREITEQLVEIMDKIQVICDTLVLIITDETKKRENQTLLLIILDYLSQGQDKLLNLLELNEKSL